MSGSFEVSAASGEGHEVLATGWVAVTDVDVKITAATGKTRFIGTTAVPRSVRYAGHFGIGAFSDGSDWTDDPVSIVEWRIDREFGDYIVPTENFMTVWAQSVYWRLAPGVTARIRVFWA